jgi:hypothetical protein
MAWGASTTITGPLRITAAVLRAEGNLTLEQNASLEAESFTWSGDLLAGIGQVLSLLVPEVIFEGSAGAERMISSNLKFGGNSTLRAPGIRATFAGSLGSSSGSEALVLTAGPTGNFSFLAPVGAGAGQFENLLVQGGTIAVGAGSFLRAGTVTVDSGIFENYAGNGAVATLSGRAVIFSDNPNHNSPTSFNLGLNGYAPLFDQPARIRILGPGLYEIGNSLPGGNLAAFADQLAEVLSASDLAQFVDQQAYLAAVPVTAFELPRPDLNPLTIRESPVASDGPFHAQSPVSMIDSTPFRSSVSGPAYRAGLGLRAEKSGMLAQPSYSQYSQGFNSWRE